MRKIALWFVLFGSSLLAACGGGDAFQTPGAPQAPGSTPPAVGSIAVASNVVSVSNDGTQQATITAFVRDAQNRLIAGVPVTFESTSGALTVVAGTTSGATITAVAQLGIAGDASLRTITVTARAGGFSATVNVGVVAPTTTTTPASIALQTSLTNIQSDGGTTANITAFVRDSSNRFMQGVPVTFTSTSGGLTVVQATSDANGQAKADLVSAGDPTNRTITVTASAQGISATINIDVTGSTLSATGPSALVIGQTATYTVSLLNAGNRGIAGRTIAVSSARGNTLSSNSLVTDNQGRATVDVTVIAGGAETLTFSGLTNLSRAVPISVNADSFQFTTPATDGLEVPLGTPQSLTATWLSNNAPVVGQTVTFSTTRGTLNGTTSTTATGVTNGAGQVSVTVQASNAGGGVVTATSGNATANRQVEFIAQTAAFIDVQPDSFNVSPQGTVVITATVRDPSNNLVKNKVVSFGLADITGGTLSAGTAVTNSQGRASVSYTASNVTSAKDGVVITASVQGASSTITKTVALTVANKEVFMSLGTGNTITEPNEAQYRILYTVIVTDSNGNAVPNVSVDVNVLSTRYYKGIRVYNIGASFWRNQISTLPGEAFCNEEDVNRNGVLDAGEDYNSDGRLSVGNIVAATSRVTTGVDGSALITLIYPQEWAYWDRVRLEVRTTVSGTEFVRSVDFDLAGAATDFSQQNTAPPGIESPAGTATTCANPN